MHATDNLDMFSEIIVILKGSYIIVTIKMWQWGEYEVVQYNLEVKRSCT